MTENILEVTDLVKSYGDFRAVDGISFAVPRGKIVGFLGPNGAGKTTTIQMLLGITNPTSGRIAYFGHDFFKHKQASLQRINFASAFNTLQEKISVRENFLVFGQLYGVKDITKKITSFEEHFRLNELLPKRYIELSAGQRTRVNMAKALLNDPEILLMDEPTASLDPDIADSLLSFIETLQKEQQTTILYTSHNMNEITRICDEVIFLDHGKIVAQDTPLGLTKRITTAVVTLTFDEGKEKLETYLQKREYRFSFPKKNTVTIITEEKLLPKLIFAVSQLHVEILDMHIEKPTLEDVFLQIARGGRA